MPCKNRTAIAIGNAQSGRCVALEARERKALIMKVRTSLRSLRRKPGAKVVRRRNRIMVLNRKNPRWSGRQG
ncbi:hypothetical protein Afe04nite_53910 [Asanoa ferruginea]|nr:hypothetical protein Afe04nite_53910 [Asanoa ferruginea]